MLLVGEWHFHTTLLPLGLLDIWKEHTLALRDWIQAGITGVNHPPRPAYKNYLMELLPGLNDGHVAGNSIKIKICNYEELFWIYSHLSDLELSLGVSTSAATIIS